ncbi:MAG TPA: hypothetical protein VFR04_06860 [Solirubrobacterales bacterium]|nr:hypothetical protein [Solirubrobacterales bacterium]
MTRIALIAVALLALLVPGGAAAATVVNGDFETGTLSGWHARRATEAGSWFAYKGTDAPIGSKRGDDPVQAPPQGAYAAITDEANPDTLVLYQDIALEPGRSHWLSLLAYYNSDKPIAVPTPDTLAVDDEVLRGQRNQQYRIDVLRPTAPLESVDPADVLLTLFRTMPGGPKAMPPTRITADLSGFAGQTVRLRIATAAHEEVFNAGVDAVSISAVPPGQSPPGRSKQFSLGRTKANRSNGTLALQVRVPGPGSLTAKGSSAAPTNAVRASKAKGPWQAIKPVNVKAPKAGTVTITLRPTQAARAVLRRKHKLRVKVTVTYVPAGGSPEAASLPVTLRLAHLSKKLD